MQLLSLLKLINSKRPLLLRLSFRREVLQATNQNGKCDSTDQFS